jgi:hypothetical protein
MDLVLSSGLARLESPASIRGPAVPGRLPALPAAGHITSPPQLHL